MLYVYIRVYFSVCITCIICARAYVCKYSVNVQSTCVCENVDVACVPLSTIQVIREHHSQITPSPTLLLHSHCRGVADQVYSLSLFVIVCVRCVRVARYQTVCTISTIANFRVDASHL